MMSPLLKVLLVVAAIQGAVVVISLYIFLHSDKGTSGLIKRLRGKSYINGRDIISRLPMPRESFQKPPKPRKKGENSFGGKK